MNAAGSTLAPAQRGFTLIEVMVVVVIIGLLAAIVAPNLIGNIDTAAVTRARGDIRAIETAPFLPGPRSNLAVLLAQAGQFAAAEALLLEELDIDPGNETAVENLRRVREQAGHRNRGDARRPSTPETAE